MNRKEFVNVMAGQYGISKKQASEELKHVLDTIVECIGQGIDVSITGYLKVKVKEVSERMGHNPKTGDKVLIPTHNQVRVSVGQKLKQAVK
jgi:DNA-binding protein HU-beta